MLRLPKTLNREQITGLVSSIDEPWLMVAILLGLFCGLRRREVCQLKIKDVDLSEMKIRVENSKNPNRTSEGYGKDRIVPLPERLIPILKTYLNLLDDNTGYLFPSIKNIEEAIAPGHLWRAYKQALQRANLNHTIKTDTRGRPRHQFNFHTLRHTYATLLWEKTGDILTVKQALGHSKIETTMVYTHASNQVVQEKVQEAFGRNSVPRKLSDTTQLNPIGILTRRLALGEIDMPTFKRMRQELRNTNDSNNYIG